MTEGRNRPSKHFSLLPETIAKIHFRALHEGVNDSKALDLIVSEWANGKEIEPLKITSEPFDLSEIESKLERVKY
ncbi:MAG: hypothetical protein AAF383_03470 [Cyanobacteria bacterium P01_A01_bin.83]